MSTLYERLGGADGMQTAVEIFYRHVLSDDHVAPFFDGIDMNAQMAKQKAFLTMAVGGPAEYTGRDMRSSHAPLISKGLNDSHVDSIAKHLTTTLVGLGVGEDDLKTVGDLLESLRDDVLCRPKKDT